MGFGLFAPEFRETFGLSTSALGVVSSLGFLGFLVGLLLAQFLLIRSGPERPVVSGLFAAALGMAIVAFAPNVYFLAGGVFLAATSSGFDWTPFNDAVNRTIRDEDRPSSLSVISTGTSIGIATAGVAALVMQVSGLSWRYCWAFFATVSAVVLVLDRAALRPVGKSADRVPPAVWRSFTRRGAVPLYLTAFVFGAATSVYISFAADRVREAGGLPVLAASNAPAIIFITFGLCGLAGLATGRIRTRLGLPWLLRLLMIGGAMSLVLIAVAPSRWVGIVTSAGLQGAYVMMTSAVMAFWSQRLYPTLPSFAFTSALLAMAIGSVLAAAIGGALSDRFGPVALFVGTAALPTAIAVFLRARHAQDRSIE